MDVRFSSCHFGLLKCITTFLMHFPVSFWTGADAGDQWLEVKNQWNGQWKASVWKKAEINQSKFSRWQQFLNKWLHCLSIIINLDAICFLLSIWQRRYFTSELFLWAGDLLDLSTILNKNQGLTNLIEHITCHFS